MSSHSTPSRAHRMTDQKGKLFPVTGPLKQRSAGKMMTFESDAMTTRWRSTAIMFSGSHIWGDLRFWSVKASASSSPSSDFIPPKLAANCWSLAMGTIDRPPDLGEEVLGEQRGGIPGPALASRHE
eukprot:4291074-Prymnesium_polylepis.1